MEIEIFSKPDALAADVATRLIARIADVQATGRRPQIVLTGGSIAVKIHEAIAHRAGHVPNVDWRNVEWWFGDERFVAADSADRNVGQTFEALFDHVNISKDLIHEIGADDGTPIESAAEHYEQLLKDAVFADEGAGLFDVLMLGVGPDGHIASLFPGFEQLDETEKLVVSVEGSPKPPPRRISLTFSALAKAREVWFVVSGEDKAPAVATAVSEDSSSATIPASRPEGIDRTIWFLDREAASQIRR